MLFTFFLMKKSVPTCLDDCLVCQCYFTKFFLHFIYNQHKSIICSKIFELYSFSQIENIFQFEQTNEETIFVKVLSNLKTKRIKGG